MTNLLPTTGGRGTDIGTLQDEMAEEDLRCREEVKRVAYQFESGQDPRMLDQALEEVLAGSKRRQREIFARHR